MKQLLPTNGRFSFRKRKVEILEQWKVYRLQTVDHGQAVTYKSDCPVETATSGGLQSKTTRNTDSMSFE